MKNLQRVGSAVVNRDETSFVMHQILKRVSKLERRIQELEKKLSEAEDK